MGYTTTVRGIGATSVAGGSSVSSAGSIHPSGVTVGSVHALDTSSLNTLRLVKPPDVTTEGGQQVNGYTNSQPGGETSLQYVPPGGGGTGGTGDSNPATAGAMATGSSSVITSVGNIWGGMMILAVAVIFIAMLGADK